MKRKFKLFATVASLCLSVALMAFGVYAASTVTYSVSGTVSFEAQVACTWNVTVTYGDKTTSATTKTEEERKLVANATDATASKDVALGPVSLGTDTTGVKNNIVIYTITCKNEGKAAISISVDDADTDMATLDTRWTVSVTEDYDLAGTEPTSRDAISDVVGGDLAAGETYTLVITGTLSDFTQQLTTQNLSLAFTASAKNV